METIIHLKSFSIIGKEGSTKDGKDVISRLIADANQNFSEVKQLGAKDENGCYLGFWGAMSDFSHSLAPWENNFSEGVYLYGIQCDLNTIAPHNWSKWIIPERDYLVKEVTPDTYHDTFFNTVQYFIPVLGYKLSGAAFDFTDPRDGKSYIYFPIEKDPIMPSDMDLTIKIARCGLHCGYCFFKACDGCLSCNNSCSFALCQEDKICPNVKCCKNKGIEGCYQCSNLDTCDFGFYALKPGNAKASAIFIKKYGKKAFEEATKKLLGKDKPYYTLMIDSGDVDSQVKLLEDTLNILD